ncbi:MAG: aspartokinase/homoserine dehydrogenase 1 [Lysobacterales bacterium]|jgi:aspartokinase/homoserine dehydrogenase 1
MLVQKFGGTSLADLKGFQASSTVVKRFAANEPLVAVFSAVAGVTDLLVAAIDAAEAGEDFTPSLQLAIERERTVLDDVKESGAQAPLAEANLADQERRLKSRLEGVRLLGNCPNEVRAEILASGEGFSSRLMADLLAAEGIKVRWSDTDVLPPANDDWLDSLVDLEAAEKRLTEKMSHDIQVLVLPGFYCRNANGAIQLLGRNGSDYSAAAAAAALGARTCQIWKDVDGFFTADPRIVPSARCLDEVSFEEAMELSFFGAKVISAKALAPLAASEIPCEIRNTYKPDAPGTTIRAKTERTSAVRGLSLLDHVASITLEGGGMRGRVGIARRVMEALASESISILLIVQTSSEYSITLCVRTHESEKALKALQKEFHFEQLHELITDISVQSDRAVISLVGDGMKRNRGIAARFLTAISSAGVNVEVIAQGSNECAIAVVVAHEDARSATRACHTAFFSHSSQIDVIVLGCGNVGAELLAQIQRQQEDLNSGHVKLNVRAIANSKKLLVADDTIDLANWQQQMASGGVDYTLDEVIAIRADQGLLNVTIVDCSTSEKLASHYTRFLANGFNVVTANKKANTLGMDYYRELRKQAGQSFKKFLYETNVGAGLPVIDTLHALIRSGDQLDTFQGVLSGSLSQIFGLLDDGLLFSDAVSQAMDLGFTEPDPRDDLSGMDVARKLLIIAREVGLELELSDIEVEPVIPEGFAAGKTAQELPDELVKLNEGFSERIRQAASNGEVLRYVGRIDGSRCRVSIDNVSKDNPLAAIRDGENALVLHTRYYQPIPLVLRGYGAGAQVTAAGVFADLLRTTWRPLD